LSIEDQAAEPERAVHRERLLIQQSWVGVCVHLDLVGIGEQRDLLRRECELGEEVVRCKRDGINRKAAAVECYRDRPADGLRYQRNGSCVNEWAAFGYGWSRPIDILSRHHV